MVPNRVYLDAHTWVQSVVALLVTVVLVAGAFQLQTGRDSRTSC